MPSDRTAAGLCARNSGWTGPRRPLNAGDGGDGGAADAVECGPRRYWEDAWLDETMFYWSMGSSTPSGRHDRSLCQCRRNAGGRTRSIDVTAYKDLVYNYVVSQCPWHHYWPVKYLLNHWEIMVVHLTSKGWMPAAAATEEASGWEMMDSSDWDTSVLYTSYHHIHFIIRITNNFVKVNFTNTATDT